MASKARNLPSVNGTRLIHGDAPFSKREVAPSISVTTTFKRPVDVDAAAIEFDPVNPARHVYLRYTQDNSTRAEKVLSDINGGYAIAYASGLAASFAALVHYKPIRIAITGGYHGCHETIENYRRSREVKVIGIDDEFEEGTLCWLETPVNPTGESRNIQYYADKVHAAKGYLCIDSTFGPPPLQYPFKWGADCIMHSGTKYVGGHSDLLCGILIVKSLEQWKQLWADRTYMGNMMTATAFAQWLDRVSQTSAGQEWDGVPGGIVDKVFHSSLQAKEATWDIAKQMEGGWNATFAFLLAKKEYASVLPYLVKCLLPATSLGGVESVIEHRIVSDPSSDPRLIRISIGVEELEDLKADFRQALKRALQEKAKL